MKTKVLQKFMVKEESAVMMVLEKKLDKRCFEMMMMKVLRVLI